MTTPKQIKKPYVEQTSLGSFMPSGAIRVKLSPAVLKTAGMFPRDQVEITAANGVLTIRRICAAKPDVHPGSGKNPIMDQLMQFAAEKTAQLNGRNTPPVDGGDEAL